jgi:hypothetical protein
MYYVCVCVWYEQISMISRIAWLNNLVVHEGFASKRSSHTCIVSVHRYMLMYVCVLLRVYVCMHFHDDVHITHTHMYAHIHARASTCMHAYLELCNSLVDWDVFACAYIHMHAYIFIYTHVYTGLCDGLHDGDALTFGSRQPCAAVGSLGCSVYCTDHHCWQVVSLPVCMYVCIYVCPCMLLLGPLVAASIAHCTHAHASSSRVRMCLCVCN